MCISKIDMAKVKKFFKEYLFAKFQCKNRELYRQLKDYDPKDDQKYLKGAFCWICWASSRSIR